MKKALNFSDKLNQENLLRFYVPEVFETIDSKKYDYKDEAIEKQKDGNSTNAYSKNGNKTTKDLYSIESTTSK